MQADEPQCTPVGWGQKTRAERDGLVSVGEKCFSREVLPNLSSEEVRLVRKALHNEANSMEQRQGQKEGDVHITIMKNRGCESKERLFSATQSGQGRARH